MTNGVTSKKIGGFYSGVLGDLIRSGKIDPDASTLVICGGDLDYHMLQKHGFSRATISNVDVRLTADAYAPYAWSFQDAENMTFANDSFDQVLVHNGLHHCASPHRALTEMYRVASRAVLVFEPRDSLAVRIACWLNLSSIYEIEAVIDNDRRYGGQRNTSLPNYVYRWVERDVEKTISTYDPTGPTNICYFHDVAVPLLPARDRNNPVKLAVSGLIRIPGWFVRTFLPRQGNRFAFWIGKPEVRHPWLKENRDELSDCWLMS